jgi:SOS-response transcriptional repressor LexA
MDVEWLKSRKKQLKVTDADLAAALGVERSVANKVANGKVELNARRADALAALLQVSRDELLYRAGISTVRPDGAQPVREIPLLGSVPGGNWREAIHRSSTTVPVPASEAPRDAYALTVEGDSMDLHVPDGFTIVVAPADLDLFPGRLYVVMNEDGETTFKQYREGPARLVPASSNPNHKEIPISGGGFRVLGRVVWGGKRLG